jgi:SAM-dependent methyltransferase
MPDYDVNENSDVYYQGRYWNDYAAVVRRINERISGDPALSWYHHFAKMSDRTFERALILNCGNGWVERDLLNSGLILEAVGIDYSEDLLIEARAAAEQRSLPLTYQQANVNADAFPDREFDLVVNHAAAHHIAAIDRVFREICRILPEDGWFVSMDYVGPHRNQYLSPAWEAAWQLNEQIPEALRQDLRYPHLPTMLVIDPTEAIHSELIVGMFHRYFAVSQFSPLGGAIAYPLLTHNTNMWESSDEGARTYWIERILEADGRFLEDHPDSSLFAYFAGTPDKSVLLEYDSLSKWEAEEAEREEAASHNGGEYYPRGAMASALIDSEDEHRQAQLARARAAELESELADLRSGLLLSSIRRFLDAPTTRQVRQNQLVAAVERRIRSALS